MDLFADLPAPTNNSNSGKDEDSVQDRGEKRHRDTDSDDEQNKTEKKVCKGFQHLHTRTPIDRVCLSVCGCVHIVCVCVAGLAKLKGFVAARRGEREDMQDAHVILPNLHTYTNTLSTHVSRLAYFAVFDGHGGARASQFAAEHLHHTLLNKFPKGEFENLDKLVRKCLLDTFRHTDEEFLKKASSQKPVWKDGSTATCMLVVDDDLYVANLGDSRAVLCRMELTDDGEERCVCVALSKEHNPTIYEERMRIQRAGGTVRDGRVLGVLEVSRSIGDGQYKRCGVISTPDLRRYTLCSKDKFVILACDGLFKVFSADEAVQFINKILQDESEEMKEEQTVEDGRYEAACQKLATEAVRRGCADNVTVILISIDF
ncbi:integrin-linked kinase-associated serine/threonine phosphatase 2C isoform X1 [Tachysurus fulvidraco]|uniref:integrin-linked kinase-associated serine/threonine phosphatase 2C isoform X1 n=2 Tax=Tachysurus fulvidraco TaxID=1234273 RepID=UPI000F4F9F37|nr:integrin-linked kinase-associated serine/threonine phosphatase 2C isoform X1 [Tachysurus fulvidraco]